MGWVVNAKAGLDVRRKFCPGRILSLDHPVRSEILYEGVLINP